MLNWEAKTPMLRFQNKIPSNTITMKGLMYMELFIFILIILHECEYEN